MRVLLRLYNIKGRASTNVCILHLSFLLISNLKDFMHITKSCLLPVNLIELLPKVQSAGLENEEERG